LPDRASEDGSWAASQRAIGKKKLVRSVRGRGELAARVKDRRQTARCRATSQNAFGKKKLAMELPGMIRRAGDSQCQNEEILVPSQTVISEIKMASVLRTTPCPESPTRGLRVAVGV